MATFNPSSIRHSAPAQNSGFLSKIFGAETKSDWDVVAPQRGQKTNKVSANDQLQRLMMRRKRDDAVRFKEFDVLRGLLGRQFRLDAERIQAKEQMHTSLLSAHHKSQDPVISRNVGQARAATPTGNHTIHKINAIEAQMSDMFLKNSPQGAPGAEPDSQSDKTQEFKATDFTHTKAMALSAQEVSHDPEIEEAAIQFANHDFDGAQAILQKAIDPEGERASHVFTWLTLLDFYRATEQQERFETVALDFVVRFGQAAPAWMPLQANAIPVEKHHQGMDTGFAQFDWTCPPIFNALALETLSNQCVAQTSSAALNLRKLDWSGLVEVEPTTWVAFGHVLTLLAKGAYQWECTGMERLQQTMRDAKAALPPRRAQAVWLTELELLRCLNAMSDYDATALDYCVTYEISPPQWESPRCQITQEEQHSSMTHVSLSDTQMGVWDTTILADGIEVYSRLPQMEGQRWSSGALSGTLIGDAKALFSQLDHQFGQAKLLALSCKNLIRVDFVAAGALLNWVLEKHQQGRIVHLLDAHRLVAAFLQVMGVSEYATVTVRND